MNSSEGFSLGRAISHGFPILVLLLVPAYAWALLALPAVAVQWHVRPDDRVRVTGIYVFAITVSVLFFAFGMSLIAGGT